MRPRFRLTLSMAASVLVLHPKMRGIRYSGPERLSPKRILQGLDPEEPGEACLSRAVFCLLSCASILDHSGCDEIVN